MKKKFTAVAIAFMALVAVSLTSCGGKGEEKATTDNPENATNISSSDTSEADDITEAIDASANNVDNEILEYDPTTITSTSYGPFTLNEKLIDIRPSIKGLYDEFSKSSLGRSGVKDIYSFVYNGTANLWVMTDNNDNIIRIQTCNPSVITPDGIRIGDPMSKITEDSRFQKSNLSGSRNYKSDSFYYHPYKDKVNDIFIGKDY